MGLTAFNKARREAEEAAGLVSANETVGGSIDSGDMETSAAVLTGDDMSAIDSNSENQPLAGNQAIAITDSDVMAAPLAEEAVEEVTAGLAVDKTPKKPVRGKK